MSGSASTGSMPSFRVSSVKEASGGGSCSQ
jgi:hypothetical protein